MSGRAFIVGACVALAMLVVAAAAPAGISVGSDPLGRARGVDYRAASVTFSGGTDTVLVQCPARKRLAGGGAAFADSGGPGGNFITQAAPNYAVPTIPRSRSFAGSGVVNGPPDQLTAFATCVRHAGLRLVAHTRRGLPVGLQTAKARCPHGTSVTGGGASAPNSDGMAESRPYDSKDPGHAPDDGWTVRVAVKGSLTATAICTRKLDLAYRTATAHGTGSLSAVAGCPDGTAVTGGGGRGPGGAGNGLTSLLPADIGDANSTPEDGYLAVGTVTGSHERKLKAFAICKR